MSLIADIKTYIVSENKFVINALQSDHQSSDISRGKRGDWRGGTGEEGDTHHAGLEGGEGAAAIPEAGPALLEFM